MKYFKLLLLSFFIASSANADNYQFYFPTNASLEGGGVDELLVVNTTSANAVRVSMASYKKDSHFSTFTALAGVSSAGADFSGYKRLIQDVKNSNLVVKDLGILNVAGSTDGVDFAYSYDRLVEIDLVSGNKTSETLIASNQAEYDAAIQAGFDALLIAGTDTSVAQNEAEFLTTYSSNLTNTDSQILTNGGFSTNEISAADGSSLFRQEADGTVHIGENSIVLADELVSASGNDEIYSSSGTLQLGNNTSHNTIVMGTIEVPDPILPSHAANKSYVDSQIEKTNTYSDGIGAMSLASSAMIMSSNGEDGIGIGLGGIGSSSAIAIGITGTYDKDTKYSFTSSYSGDVRKLGVSTGTHWSWK